MFMGFFSRVTGSGSTTPSFFCALQVDDTLLQVVPALLANEAIMISVRSIGDRCDPDYLTGAILWSSSYVFVSSTRAF